MRLDGATMVPSILHPVGGSNHETLGLVCIPGPGGAADPRRWRSAGADGSGSMDLESETLAANNSSSSTVEAMMSGNNPALTPEQGQPLLDAALAAIGAIG